MGMSEQATTPAPKRCWLRFSLASLLILIAIGAVCAHWALCIRRADAATAHAVEAIERYKAETLVRFDVILASQDALEADLAVPLRNPQKAYEAHLRRLGTMRLLAEQDFPSTRMIRPIVEFTSHYELARRQLAKLAGDEYANAVDREFDFPYRDQFEGHPALERGL